MEALTVILVVIVIVFLYMYFISYYTHKYMTKRYNKIYKVGSFSDFITEYNSYSFWQRKQDFRLSHFGSGYQLNKYKIHADIITFNNVGIILTFLGYCRYCICVQKNKLKKEKEPMQKW